VAALRAATTPLAALAGGLQLVPHAITGTVEFTAHLPGGPVAVSLTRSELDRAVHPTITLIGAAVRACLDQLDAATVRAVILAGGSRQLPALHDQIHPARRRAKYRAPRPVIVHAAAPAARAPFDVVHCGPSVNGSVIEDLSPRCSGCSPGRVYGR
jgi:hypothetical protein